jgi:TonB family protein
MQPDCAHRVPAAITSSSEVIVNASLHIAALAGTLTLALAAAAGATTVRLVPLSPPVIGASVSTCAVPFAPAGVTAAVTELPAIAVAQNASGIAAVRVALDARGRLVGESILSSSGNRWLDRAALRTARLSRYAAETRNCGRVGGEYALVVDFTDGT